MKRKVEKSSQSLYAGNSLPKRSIVETEQAQTSALAEIFHFILKLPHQINQTFCWIFTRYVVIWQIFALLFYCQINRVRQQLLQVGNYLQHSGDGFLSVNVRLANTIRTILQATEDFDGILKALSLRPHVSKFPCGAKNNSPRNFSVAEDK